LRNGTGINVPASQIGNAQLNVTDNVIRGTGSDIAIQSVVAQVNIHDNILGAGDNQSCVFLSTVQGLSMHDNNCSFSQTGAGMNGFVIGTPTNNEPSILSNNYTFGVPTGFWFHTGSKNITGSSNGCQGATTNCVLNQGTAVTLVNTQTY
jgi:hypothetical protein